MSEALLSTNACSKVHNVLIFDNELGMGGLEKKLYDFVAGIDRSHFNVKVCCLKDGGYFKKAFEDLGTPVYDNLLTHKYDVFAYRKLLRIIEAEQIDVIYTFAHANTLIFSTMARMSRRVKGLIVSFHATGTASGGRMLHGYQRRLLRRADSILAVAHAHKEYLSGREGLNPSQITVIHNGVDAKRYHPGEKDDALRESLGIRPGERVLMTIASLKPLKRIDLLIAAAAPVMNDHDDVRLLIVGDGPDYEDLADHANRLGIGDRVIFAGIRMDVDAVLRQADLFVLSSRTEAFPNVVLEAMASGLPVVTTDVGSVREIVQDKETGLIVEPEDEPALTAALASLLDDRERAAAFGTRGRQVIEQDFKLEDMCRKRENVFSNILCR